MENAARSWQINRMKGRTFVVLLAGAIVLTKGVMALYGSMERIPTGPSILHGMAATSGWNGGGCPFPAFLTLNPGPDAISPELGRLSVAFPRVSDPNVVRETLLAQGFKFIGPCSDDPSIQRVFYSGPIIENQLGRTDATVAWKVDAAGRLEWTKGYVFHLAL